MKFDFRETADPALLAILANRVEVGKYHKGPGAVGIRVVLRGDKNIRIDQSFYRVSQDAVIKELEEKYSSGWKVVASKVPTESYLKQEYPFDPETILHKDTVVTYYPYQTATVTDRIFTLPRSGFEELEKQLAFRIGVPIDNHVVYGISSTTGKGAIFVLFHNSYAIFGLGKKEGV